MPTAMGRAVHLGLSARAGGTDRDPVGMHDEGAGVAAGGLDHPPRARAQAAAAAWTKVWALVRVSPQIRQTTAHTNTCAATQEGEVRRCPQARI